MFRFEVDTLPDAHTGLGTLPSTDGGWSQFGLYTHGLQDSENRRRQRESGAPAFAVIAHSFEKWHYGSSIPSSEFGTTDPATGLCVR